MDTLTQSLRLTIVGLMFSTVCAVPLGIWIASLLNINVNEFNIPALIIGISMALVSLVVAYYINKVIDILISKPQNIDKTRKDGK